MRQDAWMAWTHGDLDDALEAQLDQLLTVLSPGWQAPPPPSDPQVDNRFRDYWRRSRKRTYVAEMLQADLRAAQTMANGVLAAIVRDEDGSSNRQLIEPMVAAIGRSAVQQFLVETIRSGSLLEKVCAVRAWYWSQPTLVYRSLEDMHARRATSASQAAVEDADDVLRAYRTACLTAFVECDHTPTRSWLGRGFVLREDLYPRGLHDQVSRARAIAESDPETFADLLAKTEDGTNMIAITP
jgi:sulfur transfer complex TusBCD TusB component (DsrH family)